MGPLLACATLLVLSAFYLLLCAGALVALAVALLAGSIGWLGVQAIAWPIRAARAFWKWWYLDWAAARASERRRIRRRQSVPDFSFEVHGVQTGRWTGHDEAAHAHRFDQIAKADADRKQREGEV
jgi:hypothetical protein